MRDVGDLSRVLSCVVVSKQRERSCFTRTMAVRAVLINDRRDIVRPSHRGVDGHSENQERRPARMHANVHCSTSASEHPMARVSGLLGRLAREHGGDRVFQIVGGRHGAGASGGHPQIVDAAMIDQVAFGIEHRGFGRGRGVRAFHQLMLGIAQRWPGNE